MTSETGGSCAFPLRRKLRRLEILESIQGISEWLGAPAICFALVTSQVEHSLRHGIMEVLEPLSPRGVIVLLPQTDPNGSDLWPGFEYGTREKVVKKIDRREVPLEQ